MAGFEEDLINEMLDELIELPDGTAVAVDTETTGLKVDDDSDKVIGMSFTYSGGSAYVALAHESGGNVGRKTEAKIAKALRGKTLLFANVQFDLIGLLHRGIDLVNEDFYDIMTMSVLIDENRPINRSLDSLGSYYCGSKKLLDPYVEKEKKSGNHNITPEEMWDYACVDTELTYKVYAKLIHTEEWQRLQAETDVWPMKQRLIRLLIRMRLRGIRVDTKLTRKLEIQGLAEQAALKEAMEFNPASSKDNIRIFIEELGLPIVKRTPKKAPCFDKEAMGIYEVMLEKLDSPLADQVKRFRGWQKATSACYTPYLSLLGKDGRLHATFNTHRTVTGRLSSSDPNLQQIPKESDKEWNGKVKKCFIPDPGYVLLSFDYSQLELRLATAYAEEPSLVAVFAEGRDVFNEMSDELGLTRQDCKTFTYLTQYGGGPRKLSSSLSISEQRAKQIIADYKASYPRMAKLDAYSQRRVKEQGYLSLWTGRRRRFQYKSESYKAMNSLIQGGAADIVERIMIRLFDEIDDEEKCRMLLQVHDAVVFEVREDLVDEYMPKIKALMEDINAIVPEHIEGTFDVHFNVAGERWE